MQINVDINKYTVKVTVTPDEVRCLFKDPRIYNVFITIFDEIHTFLELISENENDHAVIDKIADYVIDNW